jgi:hypothetical protein
MDELGERLRTRKEELMAQIEKNGLPPPETRSFTGHKMRQGAPVEAEQAKEAA